MIKVLDTCIQVVPSELHRIPEYIFSQLQTLEEQIFNQQCGYLKKIVKIISIKFHSLYTFSNDGSLLFDVTFEAECINPQPGDILECDIRYNENIIFCCQHPLHIIIRGHLENAAHQKRAEVKIAKTQLDKGKNIIKVLADFV